MRWQGKEPSASKMKDFREKFAQGDTDGNGELTVAEMYASPMGQSSGMPFEKFEEEVKAFLALIDADGDGKVSFTEFVNFAISMGALEDSD